MNDLKNEKIPWTPKDEQEHFPCILEWWAGISFFKTVEDNKKWNFKAVFTQWFENKKDIGSKLYFNLYDLDKNEHFTYEKRKDNIKLESAKGKLDLKFDECYVKGTYPNYEFLIIDKKNDIKINISYESQAHPHWIAQDVTDGWLPMGFGFYRYSFVPNNKTKGTLEIKGKKYKIEGTGYFEHVWGDFWYDNPFGNIFGFRKTLPVYGKLFKWWKNNNKITIPNSIKFGTENNPFGYDWAWAVFDNGWSVFYGNILFFIMEGPVAGILIFTKDGKTYKEFSNISFKYNNTFNAKNYDFVYPNEFELVARYKNEELNLKFKMISEPIEYTSKFPSSKIFHGFVICEGPGIVEGYYSDGKSRVKLSGISRIEPQRQASVIGHNSIDIHFIKPPKGVGFSILLESNLLKKKAFIRLKFAPKLKINFHTEKIKRP